MNKNRANIFKTSRHKLGFSIITESEKETLF